MSNKSKEDRSRRALADIVTASEQLTYGDCKGAIWSLQLHLAKLEEAPIELDEPTASQETHKSYQQQYIKCGKARCQKCSTGPGHGPYWYAYWSESGRTKSEYIGKHRPGEQT